MPAAVMTSGPEAPSPYTSRTSQQHRCANLTLLWDAVPFLHPHLFPSILNSCLPTHDSFHTSEAHGPLQPLSPCGDRVQRCPTHALGSSHPCPVKFALNYQQSTRGNDVSLLRWNIKSTAPHLCLTTALRKASS